MIFVEQLLPKQQKDRDLSLISAVKRNVLLVEEHASSIAE